MSPKKHVPVVGLVGGVGSGKSSIARRLNDKRNILVIDGDAVGHAILEFPDVQQQIRSRFGETVFDRQGRIERSALAQLVFGDTQAHQQARRDLENIVHPEIKRKCQHRIQQARDSQNCSAVILDAAVLFEAGWDDLCDVVVFVDVPYRQRLQRVKNRGWTAEQWQSREASQLSVERKRELADFVLDNSGTLEAACSHLEEILGQLADDHS